MPTSPPHIEECSIWNSTACLLSCPTYMVAAVALSPVGDSSSLDYRFLSSMQGGLGIGANLDKWGDADFATARKWECSIWNSTACLLSCPTYMVAAVALSPVGDSSR
jgi:hypothetical protein